MESLTVMVRRGAEERRVMLDPSWTGGRIAMSSVSRALLTPPGLTFLSSTTTVSCTARGLKQWVGSGNSGRISPGAAAMMMALRDGVGTICTSETVHSPY